MTSLPMRKAPASQHVNAEALLYVLDGWQGQDDWGMKTYPYPETVRELLTDLQAGDDPRALRLIARLTGIYSPEATSFKARVLWKRAPAHMLREWQRVVQSRQPA